MIDIQPGTGAIVLIYAVGWLYTSGYSWLAIRREHPDDPKGSVFLFCVTVGAGWPIITLATLMMKAEARIR